MSDNRYTMDERDIYDEACPLRDTDIVDRLNEQDDDIQRLCATNAALVEACKAALGAFEHNHAIDWNILSEALALAGVNDDHE